MTSRPSRCSARSSGATTRIDARGAASRSSSIRPASARSYSSRSSFRRSLSLVPYWRTTSAGLRSASWSFQCCRVMALPVDGHRRVRAERVVDDPRLVALERHAEQAHGAAAHRAHA